MRSVKELFENYLLKESILVLISCFGFSVTGYAGILGKNALDEGSDASQKIFWIIGGFGVENNDPKPEDDLLKTTPFSTAKLSKSGFAFADKTAWTSIPTEAKVLEETSAKKAWFDEYHLQNRGTEMVLPSIVDVRAFVHPTENWGDGEGGAGLPGENDKKRRIGNYDYKSNAADLEKDYLTFVLDIFKAFAERASNAEGILQCNSKASTVIAQLYALALNVPGAADSFFTVDDEFRKLAGDLQDTINRLGSQKNKRILFAAPVYKDLNKILNGSLKEGNFNNSHVLRALIGNGIAENHVTVVFGAQDEMSFAPNTEFERQIERSQTEEMDTVPLKLKNGLEVPRFAKIQLGMHLFSRDGLWRDQGVLAFGISTNDEANFKKKNPNHKKEGKFPEGSLSHGNIQSAVAVMGIEHMVTAARTAQEN